MDAIKQLASDRRTRDRIEGRRDGLILEARLAGETWPVIANAVGLTELATRNAAKRANGGLLPDVEANTYLVMRVDGSIKQRMRRECGRERLRRRRAAAKEVMPNG